MNKINLLAVSVALALSGCGGDDNKSSTPEEVKTFTVTAIDGYLSNAFVGVQQGTSCELINDLKTNENGQAEVPLTHQDSVLCIKAVEGQTIDMTRGLVEHDFSLATPVGSTVINPINSVVVGMMQDEESLTEEEAKAKILQKLEDAGLEVTEALTFGDYHADDVVDSEEAKALNIIGEVLVDNDDRELDDKLQVVEKVAEVIKTNKDKNDGKINNGFKPIVDIPEQGGDITVTENHHPVVNKDGWTGTVSIDLDDPLSEIDVTGHFSDEDGDTLTYSLVALKSPNALSIDKESGILSGTPEQAGSFDYQIFATDDHGARSYPLNLNVTIEAPNEAPVLDEEHKALIQKQIDVWTLTQGKAIVDTIDANALFTDADDDELTFTATSTLDSETGFSTNINAAKVSFSGVIPHAASAGSESLTISVSDGIYEAVSTEFHLPEIKEAEAEAPKLGFTLNHFNNANWKMGSFAFEDGEVGYASFKNNNNALEFCWGEDDDDDNYITSISYSNHTEALAKLAKLDEASDYSKITTAECFPIELKDDGEMQAEGMVFEMLYITSDNSGGEQILFSIDNNELCWLDSTDTPFAQTLTASDYIANGKTEYHVTVESKGQGDDVELSYFVGEYIYSDDTFDNSSILPEGFYTPGTWSIHSDSNNNDIIQVVEEQEDEQTRSRYVYRDFGDFYISIQWRAEKNSSARSPEFGLFSANKDVIYNLVNDHLPVMQD